MSDQFQLHDDMNRLERRLESDADQLREAPNAARVGAIMQSIRSDQQSNHLDSRPAVAGRIGWLAPLAIAAAVALVAAPILVLAIRAPKTSQQFDAHQQAAAIRSAFNAFDNMRLPEIPEAPKKSFTMALQLATPETLTNQTRLMLEDSRRIAEHFLIPIPQRLLPKENNAAPEEVEAPEQTSMTSTFNPYGAT